MWRHVHPSQTTLVVLSSYGSSDVDQGCDVWIRSVTWMSREVGDQWLGSMAYILLINVVYWGEITH